MSVGRWLGTLGMEILGIWKPVLERRWGIAGSLLLPQYVEEVSELVTQMGGQAPE